MPARTTPRKLRSVSPPFSVLYGQRVQPALHRERRAEAIDDRRSAAVKRQLRRRAAISAREREPL